THANDSSARGWRLTLNDHSDSLAAANAQRREPALDVAATHLIEQAHQDTRAAGANRMTQSDGAAIDVDARRVKAKLTDDGETLGRKGFVQLEQIDVGKRQLSFFKSPFSGRHRPHAH